MNRHLTPIAFILCLGGAWANVAAARPPVVGAPMGAPPAGIARVIGVVSAISSNALNVRGADGRETLVALAPGWVLVMGRRIDADAIQPGALIASANVTGPDGAGRAVELRIFEPGAHVGQGNRAMPVVGQMMTNGMVAKATDGASGRELDVTFPGGARHIVVPANIGVVEYSAVDPAALKPGVAVTALAAREVDGSLRALRVSLEPAR